MRPMNHARATPSTNSSCSRWCESPKRLPRHEGIITELRDTRLRSAAHSRRRRRSGDCNNRSCHRHRRLYRYGGALRRGCLRRLRCAASAGRCRAGCVFRNDDEVACAHRWGSRIWSVSIALDDIAKGDCIFAATGVTDGSLLDGVHRGRGCDDGSIVMRASTGTVRRVSTEYRESRAPRPLDHQIAIP